MIYNQSPLTVPTYITAGEPVNASVVNRLVQNSNGLVTRVTESSNNLTVISGNSNVTITANQDVLILCNNTTNITVTLPPASTQYKRIVIKKTANNTNTVTIQRAGSDTIEDPTNPLTTPTATSYVLATVDSSVTYVSSGNTWRVADLYSTKNTKVKAWRTGALALPAATYTTIVFDNEVQDTQNIYNTSTGVFTAPVTGEYLLTGHIGLFSTSARDDVIALDINGTETLILHQRISNANAPTAYSIAQQITLTAGQYIRVQGYTSLAGEIRPGKNLAYVQFALL